MVNGFVVEKIDDYLRDEMSNEDNDDSKQLGAMLGLAFSSSIVDYFCDTKVNDYIIFSTFDCSIEIDHSKKTIAAGIIVLGKVIPLKTEIEKDILESK